MEEKQKPTLEKVREGFLRGELTNEGNTMLSSLCTPYGLVGNIYKTALILVSSQSFIFACTHSLVKREEKIRLLRLFEPILWCGRPHCWLKVVQAHHMGNFSTWGSSVSVLPFSLDPSLKCTFLGVC